MRSIAVVAALCLLSTFVGSAHGATALPEVLFIMDSSGSMAEEAGGARKIDAAKSVMRQIVPELPAEVRVGLIAYGHRRPGDCTDIEVLLPAGSEDRSLLLNQVDRLQPNGKTPITGALLTATSMLKTKDAVTSVVLVSDGIETCGGDPCRVVRELKTTGCKFVMHTVGFNVDAAAAKQLKCLAEGGGGSYFAAADGQGLLTALRAVAEEVAEEVEQAKVQGVAAATGLGKLRLSMPDGAEKSLAYVEIHRVSDNKLIKTISSVEPDSNHPLVSGEYRLSAGFKQPNHGEPTRTELGIVRIAKGDTQELRLGAIVFNLPLELVDNDDWKQELHVESVSIHDAGTGQPISVVHSKGNGYYNFKDKPVVPGMYDVKFHYSNNSDVPTTVARRVTVKPGLRTTITMDSGIQFAHNEGGITAWRLYRTPEQAADAAEDHGVATQRELAFQARAYPGLGGSLKDDNLFYPYLLPEGVFDIEVDVAGMTEPLPVASGVTIKRNELLHFDAGL